MGNISEELEAINSSVYGDDVRNAIVNALLTINSYEQAIETEIADARVDSDGIIYASIGESIRVQASQRLQKVQYGKALSDGAINSKDVKDVSITFSTPFVVAPVVMVAICLDDFVLSNNYGLITLTVQNVTINGFTVRIHNNSPNTVNLSFYWTAIDMGET